MNEDRLYFAGVCDWAGLVRGKAFPAGESESRLKKGMGLAPTNIMISCFGPIYTTPFGTGGELSIRPDPATLVDVPFADETAERFYLGDIVRLDGSRWEPCPRTFLRRALDALAEHGLEMYSSFEQEFVLDGVEHRPGAAYTLDAFRRQGSFGERLMAAIRAAGYQPDSFLPEYGPRQYEATIGPEWGVRAADAAVTMREMTRALAWRQGMRAVFVPMLEPGGVGNGLHIHMSLWHHGVPVTGEAGRPYGLSRSASAFCAGVLEHLPAVCAFTVPSAASYYRLTPNRWAPVQGDISTRDRGAAIRVAPIFEADTTRSSAAQCNVEFRVADAACCPYLALGALVWAGVDGIARGLELPAEGEKTGAPALPRSLDESLQALADDLSAKTWWNEETLSAYLDFKRCEIAALDGLGADEICRRYAAVY